MNPGSRTPQSKKSRKVFRLLAVSLLALNTVAVTYSWLGLEDLYRKTLEEAEVRSQNLTLAVDLALSNEVSKIDLSLRTVASELHYSAELALSGVPANVQLLIANQKSLLPETSAWSIANADGQVIAHESAQGPATFSIADRDYFRALKSATDDRLLISKPLLSRFSSNPVLIFARRITAIDGRFIGIVAVPLPISYFNQLLSGFDVGMEGTLALRDVDQGLITRILLDERGVTYPTDDPRPSKEFSFAYMRDRRQATYVGTASFDRIERVFSYRLLSNAPIYALIGVSKSHSLAEWRKVAWRQGISLVFILLLANGSAVVFYRLWRRQRINAVLLRESGDRLMATIRELEERDSALRAAQEAGGLGTYSLSVTTGIWSSSEALDAIFGIDDSYARTVEGWTELVHPDDRDLMARYFAEEVVGRRQVFDREYRVVRPADQRTIWVHGLGKLDLDADGEPVRMYGTIRDITTRKSAEARLRLTEEVFQNASEGILVTTADGSIVETNPAFERMTGYSSAEVKGQTPRLLKSGLQDQQHYESLWRSLLDDGHWEGLLYNKRKDGLLYAQQTHITAIPDARGAVAHYVAVVSDVTELKENQQRLEHMAYHDALTGLPNRTRLAEQIKRAMTQCQRGDHAILGVCCLDLDGFKRANDRWGHHIGDQLLLQVAERLKACTRGDDTVARLGGDEFVVLLCNLKDREDGVETASRLIAHIAEPYLVGEVRESLTVSIGMTFYPSDTADNPDVLLRQADQAMYEAKRNGKNRMQIYDVHSDRKKRDDDQQYSRLVEALARGEFELYYQPKVDLRAARVAGVEALLRWRHPELGLLPPTDFLPFVEETDLVLPLGEWILKEALRQKAAWQDAGVSLQLSINIFAQHLQRFDFVSRLKTILAEFPSVDPVEVELEIVETTALHNMQEITERILHCAALGVQFSLDDFGTGYSSLTYLRQLPVTRVKIDRSFVSEMLTNAEDQAVIRGIVGMSHTLGREVVAEGVETVEHGALLRQLGCDWAQGYSIARPMAPGGLVAWVRQWSMPDEWRSDEAQRSRRATAESSEAMNASTARV
ncbi:MAG: EAL domain-containing protein [Propionivibrio sp.]